MFKIGIIQSSRGIPPPPPPAGDNTPDPVDWGNVIHEIDPNTPPTLGDYFFYSYQQITGITNSIDLQFFYSPNVTYEGEYIIDVFNLYYQLTNFDPVSWDFTQAPSNQAFSFYPATADLVTPLNNYYLSFGVQTGAGWNTLRSRLAGTNWAFSTPVVVTNQSDSSTQLDTFTMIIRFRGSTRPVISLEPGEEEANPF